MQPQLAHLQREFHEGLARAQALAALPHAAWAQRPPTGGWSVAECVGHLNLTARAFLPRMTAAIERGRRDGATGTGPFSRGFIGAALAWYLEPPYRLRSKTAAAFVPGDPADRDATMAEFTQLHRDLVACLQSADGLDLNRLMVASPFAERLQYNLYAAFSVTAAHLRRHLWQAECVRASLPQGRPEA